MTIEKQQKAMILSSMWPQSLEYKFDLRGVAVIPAAAYLDRVMDYLSAGEDDYSSALLSIKYVLLNGLAYRYHALNKALKGALSEEKYIEDIRRELMDSIDCFLGDDPSERLEAFTQAIATFDFSALGSVTAVEYVDYCKRYVDRELCTEEQYRAMCFILQRISALLCYVWASENGGGIEQAVSIFLRRVHDTISRLESFEE